MNKITTVLKHHYDIDAIDVSPQQGGWSALAYKVTGNGHACFLKVYEKSRASTPKWTALIDQYVPILIWLFRHSGLKGKIPVPLPTNSGQYKCEDDDGIYLLYDYIEGETIGDRALTAEQVEELARIVAELHRYGEDIPLDTDAIKEHFEVPFLRQLRNALSNEFHHIPNDIQLLITPYTDRFIELADTVDRLSVRLRNSNVKMTLCHTDIHPWNLMQSGRRLLLIDWEGLKLAPVEADMMFFVEEPYYDEFMSVYRKYHKSYAINPDALQFYQWRRKLEDIWEWLEQLLFDSQNAEERKVTVNYLTQELKTIMDH
ncbi:MULTISPECIES: phosphotransferase family protein [unclassified Paenibacillus]|uniref:phosphotransferase family protein n=1 Tax=unclassified Paenibacillus TaxID=185978 RepID=UPI001C125430|nr:MULTISPECIES: aminoglycoside phosphotransferase family protein [unclassified Paenibacillus]MBU5442742.1 aminoglycoside phosphotransferase family protein [Paenibacillus sp. MSJ-34]CAH0120940.1 Thiamine kinase [Paenibacillus sp. CECT 9249]